MLDPISCFHKLFKRAEKVDIDMPEKAFKLLQRTFVNVLLLVSNSIKAFSPNSRKDMNDTVN